MLRLITHDPASGRELVVTRLECPESGVVIEGEFSLGWVGKLTPEQIEFVGTFLKGRGNLQRAAAELGVSYNTARNRMDDIVRALGGEADAQPPVEDRRRVLERLATGEITAEDAVRMLRGRGE